MGKYYEHKKTKSGYLICAVPSCKTKKSTTTLKTFEFPSDLKRRTQWISAIVDATLKNEEETSSLEDLYSLENKRMELEMEITGVLGDHSYVCARHFRPEDITVHTHVCRLTTNAVPSVFKYYPIELPRQFFKKICQTASTIPEESSVKNPDDFIKIEDPEFSDNVCEAIISGSSVKNAANFVEIEDREFSDNVCEMIISDSPDPIALDESARSSVLPSSKNDHSDLTEEINEVPYSSCEVEYNDNVELNPLVETKFSSISGSNLSKAKLRNRYRRVKRKLVELEKKINLYNINSIERDAENNNPEALFLLDMLRTYTEFERTRKEILSVKTE